MRIRVLGETELEVAPAPRLEIEEPGDVHFGPLHMLAASLATCSVAVLWSWAEAAELDTEGLLVRGSTWKIPTGWEGMISGWCGRHLPRRDAIGRGAWSRRAPSTIRWSIRPGWNCR